MYKARPRILVSSTVLGLLTPDLVSSSAGTFNSLVISSHIHLHTHPNRGCDVAFPYTVHQNSLLVSVIEHAC